jgi:hypothetical protein
VTVLRDVLLMIVFVLFCLAGRALGYRTSEE